MILASLFATAIAVLLWPRRAAVATIQACRRVNRCGAVRDVRWADNRTARAPCVSKQRR